MVLPDRRKFSNDQGETWKLECSTFVIMLLFKTSPEYGLGDNMLYSRDHANVC